MKLVRVKRADGLKFVVTSSAYPSIKDKTYAVNKDGDEAKDLIARKIAGSGARYIENHGVPGYATIVSKTGSVKAVGYWK